ncbi:hypothetical protein MD484_g2368, partial [Candolleomyces efflorescens]
MASSESPVGQPQSKKDILLLGATGFMGRIITKYLCAHVQKEHFTVALGARSLDKLEKMVQELGVKEKVDEFVKVDVGSPESVERAVKNARVVINVVGPYWTWGTPVVAACVKHGVHYVDLTGETPWIRKIVLEYHHAATQSGAIIVPSCGYDSIPSDIVPWLANKTLKAYVAANRPGTPFVGLGTSLSAQKHKGGISGGTLASLITGLEDCPPEARREGRKPYSISPFIGRKQPGPRFIYELVIPGAKSIIGGFWVMRNTNVWLVQRTFGLFESRAHEVHASGTATEEEKAEADKARYGPDFVYDEFLQTKSKLSAFVMSACLVVTFTLLTFVRPVRALVKKFGLQSGEGPSEEAMKKGYFEITNITTAGEFTESPITVQTVVTGKGDPGYQLTGVMISESALSLLLPVHNWDVAQEKPAEIRRTTPFAKQGGVLTPMTAFGEDLVNRFCTTSLFTFASYVLEDNGRRIEAKDKDV